MDTKAELRAERDHYKNLAEEGLAPRIKDMRLENGEFNMAVVGPITEYIATAFIGQFKAGGAENFMEMNFHDRDEPFQRYILTVQKVGAKSPADKLRDAEARIVELEAALRPFVVYTHDDYRKGKGKYILKPENGEGGGWYGAEDFRAAYAAFIKAGQP